VSPRAIADAVQASLIATLDIPEQDRFQLIQEFEDEHFIHTDAFLDLTYTRDLLMIEIAFIEGRSDGGLRAGLQQASLLVAESEPRRHGGRCHSLTAHCS
jgi:hypothetical protein